MNASGQTVVVLGASPRRDRYSNMAVRLLMECGYRVIPVNPGESTIEGLKAIPRVKDIHFPVHTLTLYLGPERSSPLIDEIVDLKPDRVIFNPGTENEELESRLEQVGIQTLCACTLVMVRSGRF